MEHSTNIPQQTSQKDSQSWSIYRDIQTLPLSRFIDATVDQNIYALIIKGDPPKETLIETWQRINEQYAEEIGGNEALMYQRLFMEAAGLSQDYQITLHLIKCLDKFRNHSDTIEFRGWVDLINKNLKTSFTFNKDDADFEKQIKSCKSRSGAMKINLDLKQAQIAIIEKKQDKAQKIDRRYFTQVLIALSNHAKYPITDNVSVCEYCTRIKQLNLYLQALTK